ncbi:MAG: helix-turn-helix transcriptional regulator, partial [Candidatus Eremiobacteraeota bacterium]|nr:helix-turn-helix transcriptional regulator [Candidatus Eremiobacteraeota bacterium]
LVGRPADALAHYRRIGHGAGIRRLAEIVSVPAEAPAGARIEVLTARARELARLIAAGKSNRDAAASMSVSEKTVEKYLTSMYAKLSLTSRIQLARFVDAQGA